MARFLPWVIDGVMLVAAYLTGYYQGSERYPNTIGLGAMYWQQMYRLCDAVESVEPVQKCQPANGADEIDLYPPMLVRVR